MALDPDTQALADVGRQLRRPRTGYRTFTLYSTERAHAAGAAAASAGRRAAGGAPVCALFGDSGYTRWFEMAAGQMPRVVCTQRHDPADLPLTHAGASIALRDVRTWLFSLPFGGLVAGLMLDYDDLRTPSAIRPFPLLFEDVDRGRHELRIDGRPVLEACMGTRIGELAGTILGADMHHVMLLPPDLGGRQDEIDEDLLQRLVSRRDEPSRARHLTARFPAEANRYPDGFAALTPGASALCGQSHEVELAVVLCGVMAIASLSSLRQIQRRAYRALGELRSDAAGTHADARGWLAERAHELGDMQLDLSFGVEAYLDMRILVPSLPVEQFHHELTAALAIPRGAAVTGTMLDRLAAAILEERAGLAAQERAEDEHRGRTWSAVAGLVGVVAIPLSIVLAFLSVQTNEIDERSSLFDVDRYGAYYVGIVLILVLAAMAGRQYVRVKYRTPSPARRRA